MQKAKVTLISIVSAAILGISCIAGCVYKYPEYHFSGMIGEEGEEELVTFTENDNARTCELQVTKPNGDIVTYVDRNYDLEMDYVKVTVGENTTEYRLDSDNEKARAIAEIAKKQYTEYLDKIMEIQTKPIVEPSK